jgi:RimJ/RimL family protein N-acetyltransferase
MGTKALQLLVRYAAEQTKLHHLVIITSQDNLASQKLAQKCGFQFTGAAREGAHLMVFEMEIPKRD